MSALSSRPDFSLGRTTIETVVNGQPPFEMAERPRLSISISITFEPHPGAPVSERESIQWSFYRGPDPLRSEMLRVQESTISQTAAPMSDAGLAEPSQSIYTPLSPSPAYSATWRRPESPSSGGMDSITAYPQAAPTSSNNPSTAPPPYSPTRHLPEYRSAESELEDSSVYRWPRRGSQGSARSQSWTVDSDISDRQRSTRSEDTSSHRSSIYELESSSPVSPAYSQAPMGLTRSYDCSLSPTSGSSSRSARSLIIIATPSSSGLSLASADYRAELEADVPGSEFASPVHRSSASALASPLGASNLRRRSTDCSTGSNASRAPSLSGQSARSSVLSRRSRGLKHFLRRLADRATARQVS